MKFTWTPEKDANTYTLVIFPKDVIRITPTEHLKSLEEYANNTGKVSDMLNYLAELTAVIEEENDDRS